MRHAKSDWDADYATDHERPLAKRGARSAKIMGGVLSDVDQVPDLIITSTAQRAYKTAVLAAEVGGWSCDLIEETRLYGGGTTHVLQAIADYGGFSNRLMVVGHEPTWSGLIHLITGARIEMKTASVAGIGFSDQEWVHLEAGVGDLYFLLHPKMFFGSQWDML